MKERDYILATNIAKARMAKLAISDILPGEEFGISDRHRGELIELMERTVEMMAYAMTETRTIGGSTAS